MTDKREQTGQKHVAIVALTLLVLGLTAASCDDGEAAVEWSEADLYCSQWEPPPCVSWVIIWDSGANDLEGLKCRDDDLEVDRTDDSLNITCMSEDATVVLTLPIQEEGVRTVTVSIEAPGHADEFTYAVGCTMVGDLRCELSYAPEGGAVEIGGVLRLPFELLEAETLAEDGAR